MLQTAKKESFKFPDEETRREWMGLINETEAQPEVHS
jgi:hypothetical protein